MVSGRRRVLWETLGRPAHLNHSSSGRESGESRPVILLIALRKTEAAAQISQRDSWDKVESELGGKAINIGETKTIDSNERQR